MTRCSVALADPADLMEAFQLLTSQESQDNLGYKIVRFKNKFHPSSTDTFKNIMVNALVRGGAALRAAISANGIQTLFCGVCVSPPRPKISTVTERQTTDVELVGELQLTTIEYCP